MYYTVKLTLFSTYPFIKRKDMGKFSEFIVHVHWKPLEMWHRFVYQTIKLTY